MDELLSQLLTGLRVHILKIIFGFFAFLFFIVVMFPVDDLGDFVTEQIDKATNNQVFIQFERLGLAFLPPAFEMQAVSVDTPFFPTLKATSMTLAPALGRLLTLNPGVSFSAQGLLKGDLSGSLGTVSAKNNPHVVFSADYQSLSLLDLSRFLGSPWEVRGLLDVEMTEGLVDPAFVDQPKVEFELDGSKVILPNTLPSNIPMLAGMIIPHLQFSTVQLRGRLINRELIIEDGALGAESDPFRGRLRGKVAVSFRQSGGRVIPEWGGYDLNLNLEMDRAFEADLNAKIPIIIDFLNKYKTVTGKGSKYSLRIQATNPLAPQVMPGQAL